MAVGLGSDHARTTARSMRFGRITWSGGETSSTTPRSGRDGDVAPAGGRACRARSSSRRRPRAAACRTSTAARRAAGPRATTRKSRIASSPGVLRHAVYGDVVGLVLRTARCEPFHAITRPARASKLKMSRSARYVCVVRRAALRHASGRSRCTRRSPHPASIRANVANSAAAVPIGTSLSRRLAVDDRARGGPRAGSRPRSTRRPSRSCVPRLVERRSRTASRPGSGRDEALRREDAVGGNAGLVRPRRSSS